MMRRIVLALLVTAIVVMAVIDAHPVSAGRSVSLLTTAAYPKVYVHLIGGMALAPLVAPFLSTGLSIIGMVTGMGVLYEAVQWRFGAGVFTWTEALAVAVGGAFVIAWFSVFDYLERMRTASNL